MSTITIKNLTFAYDGDFQPLFKNISFVMDSNWKLGLIGRNGRGKSTLLKILLGELEYQGKVSNPLPCHYFPGKVINENRSTKAVVTELVPDFEEWRLERELSLLDVRQDILERNYQTLSNGEKTKVLLATLFLDDTSFALIDEPTNHLDQAGRKSVGDYLNSKRGFVLISHDRYFLNRVIDHVVSINKNNIDIQKGNYDSWFNNKERQDAYELEKNQALKGEITRLTQSAREKSKWSDVIEKSKFGGGVADRGFVGHKAEKMMKRSKAIEKRQQDAIEEKQTLLKNIEFIEPLKIKLLVDHRKDFFTGANFVVFRDGKSLFKPLDFSIKRGERIALQGKNGSGKSSLFKVLLGEDIDYTGVLIRGNNLKISYVQQDFQHLKGSFADFIESEQIQKNDFFSSLMKLGFKRVEFEKQLEELSNGQKKKILLAKSLIEEANLYIWDEPLNYIDIISRLQLEELLGTYQPTMIFVEHDQAFVQNIATKIITLESIKC